MRWSLRRQRPLVLRGVQGFPFALHDSFPDLCRCFPFANLLVAVEVLINTGTAGGAVIAGKAIEQTGVALAPVAVTITRLLVKRFLDLRRYQVRILHDRLIESLRIHCFGQVAFWSLRMIGGDVVSRGLRRTFLLCR